MTPSKKKKSDSRQEIEELRARLAEAEDTLRAIREGEVDAVVVSGSKGEQIFSLVGTDSIYRLIVETMKEAAFTVAFDGTILFCNAQFAQFVKRPLEYVVGRRFREFVAEADREVAVSLLTMAQQKPVKGRLVLQDSDGAPVPAHISANVLFQPDQSSICVVASDLRDLENSTELIQELRRQRQALQEANQALTVTEQEIRTQNDELLASRAELEQARMWYRDLFVGAPDGYLVTDPEGTIQEMNEAAGRLFGCPTVALQGNPFLGLLPAEAMQDFLQAHAALMAGTTPPRWEVEIRPRKAPAFWASITGAASRDGEGNLISLRWLLHDVSGRKTAEEALGRVVTELERSNRELEAFAYVASHDLQEPLRMVTGFLGLLKEKYKGQFDEKAMEYIDFSVDGAERMSALIKDLLEYSRVGRHGREPTQVDLAEIARGVLANLRTTINETGAVVTVDPLPTVMADAMQMGQLLQNLVGNALKFRADGRAPVVHIGARREGGEWAFEVSDNGIGFDPDQGERIFALFQRLHGRDKYPGTGIGLAICKKIVERHGGRIWAESAPGGGSTFRFTLPAQA